MAMIRAVKANGGTVAKTMGDGIMALFGAPVADEEHALQACRAALRILTDKPDQFSVRIGINSGDVVVVEVGNELELDAIGDAVNLAARLEKQAEPNTALAGKATMQAARRWITFGEAGTYSAKGFGEAMTAYPVAGVRATEAVTTRHDREGFIGRRRELDVLEAALSEATEGRGQLVSIIGEGGIGKSSLVHELTLRARGRGFGLLRAHASRAARDAVDGAISQLVRQALRLDETSEDRLRSSIGRWLRACGPEAPDVAEAVAWLIGLDSPDDSSGSVDQSSARRAHATRVFAFLLQHRAREMPVLLVIEDLHWLDASSREILEAFLSQIARSPILLVTTSRPQGSSQLKNQIVDGRTLHLGPLAEADTDDLLVQLLGSDQSLGELKRLVKERTGNNPFFVHEVIDSLSEAGFLAGEVGRRRVEGSVQEIVLPASVNTVIGARIDRLARQSRDVLHSLVVLNQRATTEWVVGISGYNDADVRQALDVLVSTGFVVETVNLAAPEYQIAHSITQEVAYRRLLNKDRKLRHRRVFAFLREQMSKGLACDPRTLGVHAFEGSLFEEAAKYLLLAGRKAYQRSAYSESCDLLKRAVAAADSAAQPSAEGSASIDTRLALRDALFAMGRLDDVGEVLGQAEGIARRDDDDERLANVTTLQIHHYLSIGEQKQALEKADYALRIPLGMGDGHREARIKFYRLQVNASLGNYQSAIEDASFVLNAIAPDEPRHPSMMTLLCRMWALWCYSEVGRFEEGAQLLLESQEILAGADDVGHSPTSLAITALGCGLFWLRRGFADHDAVGTAIETLLPAFEMARGAKLAGWSSAIASPLGYAFVLADKPREALPLLEYATREATARRGVGNALRVVHLALAQNANGDIGAAQVTADAALDLAVRSSEKGHEAYARAAIAQIAFAAENAQTGQRHLTEAIEIAKGLSMLPLLDHCRRLMPAEPVATGSHKWTVQ